MKRLLLVVLDGFGVREAREANAVALARTPTLDRLRAAHPYTTLEASGLAVGLPEGQMGNSEVGHINIGAGRVVYQDLVRITRAVESGEFFDNAALVAACDTMRAAGGRLHVLGLCSDGGVHSTLAHALAVVDLARRRGVADVFAHAFLDGRDTPPRSARPHLETLARHARVATVSGRYWAMDRDKRWDRIERAYRALVAAEGERAPTAVAALDAAYARGESDEFVAPTVVDPEGRVRDGDAVVFFNFRADRARQMTRALALDQLDGFARAGALARPRLSAYVCMTEYDRTWRLPVAFPPRAIRLPMGEVVARAGLAQFRAAETEKYAHVTYFFNGGREDPFEREERRLVPSDRGVATYDERPEMGARGVTDAVVDQVRAHEHAFLLCNFANPDMVGHTGNLEASVRAVECVDECLGRIAAVCADAGVALVITADHGNCEKMRDAATGQPHTAHTTSPVPLHVVDAGLLGARLRPGRLCDVAPTALGLMSLDAPPEMEGRSLIVGS